MEKVIYEITIDNSYAPLIPLAHLFSIISLCMYKWDSVGIHIMLYRCFTVKFTIQIDNS